MADSTIRNDIKIFVENLNARLAEYKKNEMIPQQNPDSHEIGCILKGTVFLCAEDQDYARNILRILREGCCFSPTPLLSCDATAGYLIAKHPTQIAYFQGEKLLERYRQNPQETNLFLSALKQQSEQELLSQNYILHQRTLRNKLICYFRREAEYQNSRTLTLTIPYSDLADYLGVDRSAMMKELARMKEEQLVSGKNHLLTLHAALFPEEL